MEFGTVAAELHNSAAQNGAEQSFPAGLKVLLCESQHNSADTAVLLQQLDYQVTQAADEQQAACLLQGISSPYDVILADAAVLGSGTVFEAARSSGVAVVAMTHEHSSSAEVMAAVQAGAADVLERPLCHSKLQNIWQHTVRASLTSSKSAGTKHSTLSTQHDNPTLHAQHQQQAATPRAGAAAAAGTPKHSPMCFGLLDDCLLHGLDGLGGLELPPLVPSQLEFEPLDSILSDMQQAEEASAAPMMGLLGGVLPPGSPSTSNAGTVVAASLFGSHSSEQQCNDDTNIAAAELESSADASSAGWPQNRRRKLRACTRLRSMPAPTAASAGCGWASTGWTAAAAGADGSASGSQATMGCSAMQPVAMPMAPSMGMNMGVVGSTSQWVGAIPVNVGMAMPMGCPMNMTMPPVQGQLPRGMVWGMPVRNVAVAPGIVPSQSAAPPAAGASSRGSSSADKQLGPGPTLATPVAPAVQQQQQQQQACAMGPMPVPIWPGMGMWGAMWPSMCYPGIMPQFGGMMPVLQGPTAEAGAVPAAAAGGGVVSATMCQHPGVMPVPVQQGMSGVIPGQPQFSAPAHLPASSAAAPGGMIGWGAPTPFAALAVQAQH